MEGLVTRSTGSWYQVLTDEGKSYDCRLKGKIRLEDLNTTNPIAVGDRVEFEKEDLEEVTGVIHNILDRKNYLIRTSPKKKGHSSHMIAANLDQAFLMVTTKEPGFKPGFVDRFLVMATAYDIPVTLIFNKSDVLDKEGEEEMNTWMGMYREVGYPSYSISVLENKGIDFLKTLLKEKLTLIAGQSGVGKSSLLNKLVPGMKLKAQEISDYTGKGQHTTTFATMFPIPDGGFVIDTPGVKEFGILNIEPQELGHYFPEFIEFIGKCKYNNCVHDAEPGCKVKDAFLEGKISDSRFTNYLYLLSDLQTD